MMSYEELREWAELHEASPWEWIERDKEDEEGEEDEEDERFAELYEATSIDWVEFVELSKLQLQHRWRMAQISLQEGK